MSIEPSRLGQILLCYYDNISNSINRYSMKENKSKIQITSFEVLMQQARIPLVNIYHYTVVNE